MPDIVPVAWKRSRSARFWRCPNGHAERHIAFDDTIEPKPGHAARACSVCHVGMELVTWYFLKGQLVDTPIRRRKPEISYDEMGNEIIVRRKASPRSVLRRIIRRMRFSYETVSRFKTNKLTGAVTVKISRKNESALDGYEKRHIVLESSAFVMMSVTITLVGVHGWFADIKKACQKAKIHIIRVESTECEATQKGKGKK